MENNFKIVGDIDHINETFNSMRQSHLNDPLPRYEIRIERLKKLLRAVENNENALIDAISKDFSYRSEFESYNYDITLTVADIKYHLRNLKKWMRVKKKYVSLHLLPGKAKILPQPLGVIGIISTWNLPVFLSLSAVTGALAAGNRVILKPSELTKNTSDIIYNIANDYFNNDEFSVFRGGSEIGEALANLKLNHLHFTGSKKTAKIILNITANHLTPVTLELGGKSPGILCPSAKINYSAKRIVYGKLANAGQVCITPDYVLVKKSELYNFLEQLKIYFKKIYPEFINSPDYTSIINQENFSRLSRLVEEAKGNSEKVIFMSPDKEYLIDGRRNFPFTIILNPDQDLKVSTEEIFGPILPIITYDDLDEAIKYVKKNDEPLAIYIFSESPSEKDRVLKQTISGGVSINEVLFQGICNSLPFGGVGASGFGSYHGEAGFNAFSHLKPIFEQPKINLTFLLSPPVTPFKRFFSKILRKIV